MAESSQLDELIRRESPAVTKEFLRAAKAAHNEREFQTVATQTIQAFADKAGIELSLREEYVLFNGRADAVYNRFIIEYESPGSLRDKNSHGHNKHAIGQVQEYLNKLVRRERHKPERLAGVVFNGDFYIWVRQRGGTWYIDPPVPVAPASTERFLRTLCSLSTERALIPENLVADFGENTNVSRRVVPALYERLTNNPPRRTQVLFQQWSHQFSEVCDYDQASKLDVVAQARAYGLKGKSIDPFQFFFCIHTYYAFLIKLLAVQIVHFYLMPKLGTDLRQAAVKSAGDLRKYLATMEDGGIFRQLGINNLMEGDFFGWYLDVWGDEMDAATRLVITTLGNYAVDTLDIDPESSRDLLKNLYQNLMPKVLRHNLGEYYTPDWLAERTLGLLDGVKEETVRETEGSDRAVQINVYRGDPRKRLLDPACGSGTFLVMAIRRIKEFAWRNAIPERELLSLILKNVVGFDLNPLAVISARTNYLLALGDLLQHRGDEEINIPVYLCDSIMTPSEGTDLFAEGTYSFSTSVGLFAIPAKLVEAKSIEVLTHLLEEAVSVHLPNDHFLAKASREFGLDPGKDERDLRTLAELYATLRRLDDEKINGIWARIIKNAFAPLFVGRFDLVAGNPPWVNWEHLPEQYRQSIAPLWQKYDLFRHKGLKARLGAAKDDISVLLFYVSVDRYLIDGGRIGFVITQTIFKTEGGGEGFRRFRCGVNGPAVRVIFVDDWSSLKPFEGAANKTAVIIAQRNANTTYPVGIAYWRKRAKRTSLSESAPLESIVFDVCRYSQWIGEPIDDARRDSPWITGRRKCVRPIKRIAGQSYYRARAGVCTWLNGVYWVKAITKRGSGMTLVSNLGAIGKKKVESIQCAIEDDSLFDLVRGENISRWCARPEMSIVLADNHDNPATAITELRLKRERPKTYTFFAHFEQALRERSGFKKYLAENPFYAVYNIGPYTFAPYKVAWLRISNALKAAVIEGERMIPDNAVVFVACNTAEEATFICGLINTSIAGYLVASFSVPGNGTWGSPKIMKYVAIPRYDSGNSLHRQIVATSTQAIGSASENDKSGIHGAEIELDGLAAKLWDLTTEELSDIQQSLADVV